MKQISICYLVILILFLDIRTAASQAWNRFWCFGDSAGVDFSNLSTPVPITSLMDCAESCASVGDSANGLLMYAHTDYWPLWLAGSLRTTVVHNYQHQIMENGDSLIGNAFHNGMTFINKPGSDSIFYLIHTGFNVDSGLYYSMVLPYYNSDTGIVVNKNSPFTLTERRIHLGVIAIKHANGRDWWIIVRNWIFTNKFNCFLITPDSIIGPIEQYIGSVTSTDYGGLASSKEGDKLCLVNANGLVETYEFDRCSGQILNARTIWAAAPYKLFGVELSPSGNVLYVSNIDNIFGNDSLRLFQFDLTSPNPGSTFQRIYSEKVSASGGLLKRGPNDKIYFTCLHECGWRYPDTCRNQYNENLSVINSPDSLGLSCNFSPFSFYLGGKRTYWNLPNNPNYLLGPITGTLCDSLNTSVSAPQMKVESFKVFPNPTSGELNVVTSGRTPIKARLYQSDMRLIREFHLNSIANTIDIKQLADGVYYLEINNARRKIVVTK